MKNPISVIIRTSNAEKALGRLFERLEKNEADEFIVVDTGSQDGTLAVAKHAGARIISNPPPFNYSKTLNAGFTAANNNWLLALSSHCLPASADLLECYRSAINKVPDETAVLYGSQYWSKQQYASANKETKFSVNLLDAGSNANALYARAAWLKHPFDETLKTGEDNEWRRWAKRAGLVSAFAPSAAVYYLHLGSPVYRFNKAWDEIGTTDGEIAPMTVAGLARGIGQASRRLLWEARAPRPWMGQVAHQLGSFFASRTSRKRV